MDEKTMVNDILESVKSNMNSYQMAINECENMRIKTIISANKK